MQRQRQHRSAKRHLRLICLLSLWVLWAVPAACQQTVTLEGRVRTDNGQTIPSGVNALLETGEGMLVARQPANSEGQFQFDNLRKISYRLTITADGFQPAQQNLDLAYGANKVIRNIFLTPLAKTRTVTKALPALTDNSASKKARKEYDKGVHALEGKRLSEASVHFENAVAEYPCYARAQADLALTLAAQRDLSRAEAALRKAIACDPGFPDAYIQLGQLFNAEKRFANSEAVLQEGLRRSPGAWQFYYQLAAAHYGLKQYTKAEEEYLKAQSLNSAVPPEFHVKLADVYFKKDAYDKAYTEMHAYLRAEPNGRFAAKIKTIMQQMESSGVLHGSQAPAAQPPPSKP